MGQPRPADDGPPGETATGLNRRMMQEGSMDVAALLARATTAYNARDLATASTCCYAVLERDRRSFGAHYLLGAIASLQGRHAAAAESFAGALSSRPDDARALVHYAIALKAAGRAHDAHAAYAKSLEVRRRLLEASPGDFAGRYALSKEFQQMGDLASARDLCRQALAINSEYVAARGALASYQIESVFESAEQVESSRAAFVRELAALAEWLDTTPPLEAYTAFETARVFFLAYQEERNVELLKSFGALCARTMQRWQLAHGMRLPSGSDSTKVRIGIVLAHVTAGPDWDTLARGWVEHIDRTAFDLYMFQVEPTRDRETDYAASRARLVDLTDKDLRESADAVLACGIDVLLYPEVGMNRKVAVLASLRLAPVQAASWGHPETTGLPTVDYFLSAEGIEPSGAADNYSEKLVMLPGLGCCYVPTKVMPISLDLRELGIDPARPVLICPGTPIKYAPEFDGVLVAIARRLPRAQLVFFDYERLHYTQRLRDRLQPAFAQHGLRFDEHVVFVPWLDAARFVALLAQSTLMLDSIGFSGFNTAMRAVESGLPIVTREGAFLRGRLAGAILDRLGLAELIAGNEAAYVDLAVRVATDVSYNASLRQRMAAGRDDLVANVEPVRALERFCVDAARPQRLPNHP